MPYDYIEEYQKQNDDTIWEFRDKDAQSKIDISSTETDYANPLSLETMQAQLAENTKIKLEPIQDLHGYDKPWVGGAGKNKLKIDAVNKTIAGLTYTINEDGSFYIDGTGTDSVAWIHLCSANLFKTLGLVSGQRYILSQSISNNAYIYIEDYNNVHKYEALDGSIEFLYNGETNWRVCFLSTGNITYNHVLVQPMIRLATETDSTFAPYTNICPISGHDQIDILGCGKNLIDISSKTLTGEDYIVQNLAWSIPVGTYTFSFNSSVQSGNWVMSGKNSSNVEVLHGGNTVGQPFTFTLSDNIATISIYVNVSGTFSKFQLEEGFFATDYSPYTESNNKTIILPDTVYGGELDLESGELVVTKVKDIFDGSSDENWINWNNINAFRCPPSYNLPNYSSTELPNLISNYAETNNRVTTWNGKYGICGNQDAIYFGTLNLLSVSDLRTYLASNNLEVCYELSTPYTINLTPHQLSLLKSQNTITTSQYTQVKVTYRNGVFATLEELSDLDTNVKDISDKFNALGLSVVDGKLCQTYNT